MTDHQQDLEAMLAAHAAYLEQKFQEKDREFSSEKLRKLRTEYERCLGKFIRKHSPKPRASDNWDAR